SRVAGADQRVRLFRVRYDRRVSAFSKRPHGVAGPTRCPFKAETAGSNPAGDANQRDVFAPGSDAFPRSTAEILRASVTAASAFGSWNRTWHCGSLTSRPSFTELSAT